MQWIDRICGTAAVQFSARERRIYTALMLRAGIRAVGVRNCADGGLCAELRRRDYRRLCALAEERGLPIPVSVCETGYRQVLRRLGKRPGLLVGGCLASALLLLSTLFVWRVDIVCLDNAQGTAERDRVDVQALRQELAASGIGQGMFLLGMDARSLENRFLIGRDDISWMAINRHGTVLSVEVRPAHAVSDSQNPHLTVDEDGFLCGTHLVADADGRILSFSVRGGQPVIEAEQTVLRGSLLASGIYTSETGDVVAGRAHGEVLAETVRILETEVAFEEPVVQTMGRTQTAYTLKLFGNEVLTVSFPPDLRQIVTFLETFQKKGEKSGIDAGSCGIIADETIQDAKESFLFLPGGLPLPVSVCQTTRTEIVKTSRHLTRDEVLLRADAVLDAAEEALGARRIFSREETVEECPGGLHVTRYVSCVDNIAAEEVFKIRPQP